MARQPSIDGSVHEFARSGAAGRHRSRLEPDISVAPHADGHAAVNWVVIANGDLRACVAGLLLLRLAVGLCLTWRIARAAMPIREPWTADWRVRVSERHRRSRHLRIDHSAAPSIYRLGFAEASRPCWRMRGRTSPTGISMSCCWPRSTVRCSGSILSRGGSSPAWPNWPKSSAMQGRSKCSKTGCPMRRSCSISRGRRARRRRGLRWQGRARFARVSSAFLRQPPTPRSPAGASEFGRPPPFCRLSWFPQARIAYSTTPAPTPAIDDAADAATAVRKPELAAFYSLSRTSIFAISREGNELFRTTQRATESSGWLRRAVGPIPTRRPTAG